MTRPERDERRERMRAVTGTRSHFDSALVRLDAARGQLRNFYRTALSGPGTLDLGMQRRLVQDYWQSRADLLHAELAYRVAASLLTLPDSRTHLTTTEGEAA